MPVSYSRPRGVPATAREFGENFSGWRVGLFGAGRAWAFEANHAAAAIEVGANPDVVDACHVHGVEEVREGVGESRSGHGPALIDFAFARDQRS